MRIFYNLAILLYYFVILVASLFNKKAGLWIKGRKGIFKKIKAAIKAEDIVVWFHCSSLGEFEQGRPVIEAYRKKAPSHKILITFFSPSGYEIRKNYKGADYIFYLPVDTPANANRFIKIVNPHKAFFIKYEYWYNYLNLLYKKNIPVYMISAIYRKDQHFFTWYGGWFRKHLRNMKHIFVQNNESDMLLKSIGIEQVTISGDTRFDRVYAISKENKSIPGIERFINGARVLVAGSTWEKDEEIIKELYKARVTNARQPENLKFIIAPHMIDSGHIKQIVNMFGDRDNTVLLSQINETNPADKKLLIVDSIGLLSSIYKYATITYIGGGFGSGIHNILEAAVYNKPVIFGPIYHKFREAKDLISAGGAFSVNNRKEFEEIVEKLLNDSVILTKVSDISGNYVKSNTGATEKIVMSYEL